MHIGCMCSTALIFLKKMSLAEPLWYINKNGFINNLHLKSTFYVLTQQREFFLLQPIHSSFLLLPLKFLSGVLWNGNFYTAVTRHSCMLLRATSKMLCTLFLKYKQSAWHHGKKKPKHTFFRLQLFFSPVCTVRLYRQCDLQAMRTLWSVQQTGVGRLAAAGKAAPLPHLYTSALPLMTITHSSKASRCTKAKLPQSPVQHPHSQGWKLPKISLNENHSLMAMQSVRPYTTCCNY